MIGTRYVESIYVPALTLCASGISRCPIFFFFFLFFCAFHLGYFVYPEYDCFHVLFYICFT